MTFSRQPHERLYSPSKRAKEEGAVSFYEAFLWIRLGMRMSIPGVTAGCYQTEYWTVSSFAELSSISAFA